MSVVLNAINEQIKYELYSSYMYLSMSAYFLDRGLTGFAAWMRLQAKEEVEHGMKMYDYLASRKFRIDLLPIEAPPKEWESPRDVFDKALAHEEYVTKRINTLVNLAIEHKDHASFNFLQWFVDEQVEEEESFGDIVDKLAMMKDHPVALYTLDKELGRRTG